MNRIKTFYLPLRLLFVTERPRWLVLLPFRGGRLSRRLGVLVTYAGRLLLIRTRLATILAFLGLVVIARRQLVAAASASEAGTVIRGPRYHQLLRQEDRQPACGAWIPPHPQTRPHLHYHRAHIETVAITFVLHLSFGILYSSDKQSVFTQTPTPSPINYIYIRNKTLKFSLCFVNEKLLHMYMYVTSGKAHFPFG